MATCTPCGTDMRTGNPCGVITLVLEGDSFRRVAFGAEGPDWWLGTEPTLACHDCRVALGGLHHIGCDMEMCPRCGGQLLGCDCDCDCD